MLTGLSGTAPVLHRFRIAGTRIEVYDQPGSRAAGFIAGELSQDAYGLRGMSFAKADCVVDIGGHIGLFAIWLGLRHPALRIYSYEPYPANRDLFSRNLALNDVTNVRLYPEAVSGGGQRITLAGNATNSGAATAHSITLDHGRVTDIPSLTLDQIFERHKIDRCRLLKIDCEGSEYETLLNTTVWPRVEHLCGEFHSNRLLESQAYSPEWLREHCASRLGSASVKVSYCRMSE